MEQVDWSFVDDADEVKGIIEKVQWALEDTFSSKPDCIDYMGGAKLSYRVEDRQYENTVYANAISIYFWVRPDPSQQFTTKPLKEEWQTFTWSEGFLEVDPKALLCDTFKIALDEIRQFCRLREGQSNKT